MDIAKNFADSTEHFGWGKQVHEALAAAILHKAGLPPSGTGRDQINPAPLPDSMREYQKWVDICAEGTDKLLVEQRFAITRRFQPTTWFGSDVWFRGVCDLLAIKGPVATALDWKTGKIKHDSRQLMLMAACILIHYPEVEKVKTRFVWLKEDCTTPEVFDRESVAAEWPDMIDIACRMEEAASNCDYPPKPNGLCGKYCPVISCEFHGKPHGRG